MAKKTEAQKAAARAARVAKRKKIGDTLLRAAEVLTKGAAIISHAHPVTIGLVIMGGCTATRFLMGDPANYKNNWRHQELSNLYAGAQTVALASAAVPVVAGALNLVGGALASRAPTR